jgi:hypothetical protein
MRFARTTQYKLILIKANLQIQATENSTSNYSQQVNPTETATLAVTDCVRSG